MANFFVYIDETGSFSYQGIQNSFVGGWICKNDGQLRQHLEKILKESVTKFNGIQKKKILHYPQDLHFMPMLTPRDKRFAQDQHIKIQHTEAPSFFNEVFERLGQVDSIAVFRSVGGPAIVAHEQAAYMEILRNTLIQLLDHALLPRDYTLTITIARRRTKELTGYLRRQDLPKYEKYLAGKLKDELSATFPGQGRRTINISFGDGAKNPGLILADFFCGAMKKAPGHYLSRFSLTKYQFAHGYRVIGPNVMHQVTYLLDQDVSAGILHGLEIACESNDDNLLSLLQDTYTGLSVNEAGKVHAVLHRHLDNLLIHRPDRYDLLETGKSYIRSIRQLLPSTPEEMTNDQLRLKAALDLHSIRITSHQGGICSDLVHSYIAFLHDFGARFIKNRMEFMQRLIDGSLIGVQVEAFNRLRFDKVEQNLAPVRDLYDRAYNHLPGLPDMPDENRAKLEGSMGQMYGFLADLAGTEREREEYYLQAEKSLKEDITACQPGQPAWIQGMGYLTVLYWKQEDLDKAIPQFFLETETTDSAIQGNLFHLEHSRCFNCRQSPYFLLHRLNLCALARKNGRQITGLKKIKPYIGDDRQICYYPRSLSAKWLALLFMYENDYQSALDLLNTVLDPGESHDFTIKFILLPHELLRTLCLHRLGRESSFSLTEEIVTLTEMEPGAETVCRQLDLDRFVNYSSDWDPYEVAALPPYYYA